MEKIETHGNNSEGYKKTFEDKAKEKGYYKKEDGTWWEHYGDGFDEKVEWFKLDEEYPDLADKTEALAEKYNVRYGDYSSLKKHIYENADRLNSASDEHLENIFDVVSAVACCMSGTEEKIVRYSAEELASVDALLTDYYKMTMEKMPDGKLDRNIKNVSEYLVRGYNEKLVEGNFLENVAEYSAKAFLDKENIGKLLFGIEHGIEGISKNGCSGRLFGDYIEYYDELLKDENKITKYDTKSDILERYVCGHGMSEGVVSGFREVIFPAMERGDEEAESIIKGGNAYGCSVGEYGVADYAEECLLSSYRPKDIDKLVRIYHEIPTSDYSIFEQNRKDASRLQGTIIGGRDFIHDERVGTNEVLTAILDYYNNHDSSEAAEYKNKLGELESKYHFGVLPYAFDLKEYEKPVGYMSDFNVAKEGNPNERAIDILRRLVKNTAPNLLESPKTKDSELNKLMAGINPVLNEQTGEVSVDIKEVSPAVKKINELILEQKGKQGVYPSMVSAVAFLDKMSAYALRSASKKDIKELAFDPGFKEIARFSQLTSSIEYNENDFENMYRRMTDKISEAYGEDDIDSLVVVDGYRILSQHILKNVQQLSKEYASKSTTARFSDAIWSGNLSDELIGLFQRV